MCSKKGYIAFECRYTGSNTKQGQGTHGRGDNQGSGGGGSGPRFKST